MSNISLVAGAVPIIAGLLGLAGCLFLVLRRGRRWPLTVLRILAMAVAMTGLLHWLLVDVLYVLPEDLPPEVLFWSCAVLAALGLTLATYLPSTTARRAERRRRILAPVALGAVVLLASVQVNVYFSMARTVKDLTGAAVARIPPLQPQDTRAPQDTRGLRDPGAGAAADWKRPADLPAHGAIRRAAIPGTVSGFKARSAYIYLPPAYLVDHRPKLPVLVLFSGQPGSPSDWVSSGQLGRTMDHYAAGHNGLAPVVVVADPNGSQTANTLCMDSRIARTDTYLSVDVPRWIRAHLDVEPSSRRWAVGGFSAGGTCAVELGTRHPDLFPMVLAFSAEREPALAVDRAKTVEATFGGDTARFDAQTPLVIMGRQRFPHSSIYFSVGATDTEFVASMAELSTAARKAGFRVSTSSVPGIGHSWDCPVRMMGPALDFMARQLGLAK